MGLFLAIVLVATGGGLGIYLARGVVALASKSVTSSMQMWRLGATAGPTDRDRARAKWVYDMEASRQRWLFPVWSWFVRLILLIGGAALGLYLAQQAGLTK